MMHFIVQPQKARPILAQTKQKKKKKAQEVLCPSGREMFCAKEGRKEGGRGRKGGKDRKGEGKEFHYL